MIITCSNCNTSFNLNDSLVKDTGSKVRCSKCKYVFRAFPPHVAKKPQIEKAAKTSATDRKSEDGVDAEKTPTQVFPTSDDRRQGDKKTDSPPAAAQLVPDKGTPLSFPDASINQMDGKNESFDLSELDVFFDEKDKQSDKESAKEDVFLKPDSEPGTPEPVSTASDDIDFSELDNFFGDDKIDSDPFADPFDSETFPESRTAPPETEDRENLQNIATDGNAERLTDIEEIEEIDDVEEIDEVEEIEDFDELDEPNKPGDSDGSNLESIFNEALDKESEIAIAGGESESLSESDFEGNLKNIQSILENEEDINLDDLSGDNENEIRFDIDAAENEIGQASSGKPTDTEEFGELDLSDLDELFGAEKDEDRGERVGPEPTIDIENELDEAVGKKAEDRDDEVDLAEIEGFFAEEFPPVQDNDGKVAESEETGEDMDFDLDLQTDDKPSAEDKTEDLGLGDDIDFDLDFELDDEKPSRAKPEGKAGGDLGLEPEVEDKPTAKPKAEEIGLEDDIDFDLDFEPDDAKPSGAKPDGKAGDDDLDFDLDFELDDEKPSRAKPEGTAGGDLGLEPKVEDKPTAKPKAEEIGLENDIDFEPDDAKPSGAKPEGKAGDDDLDFDLDFELDDEKPSRAKPEGKAGGDLGLEPEIEDKPTAKPKAEEIGLDFDIDFDLDFEPDDAKPSGAKPDGKAGDDDLDFDLDFELDDEKPSRAKPEGKAGGDLGLEPEIEDKPTAEAKADDLGLDDDIDFDFELDDAKPSRAKPEGKAGGDFGLEPEIEDKPTAEAKADDLGLDDDIDFDFNFELDDAKPSRAKPEGKAGGDFGLELELEDKPTAEAKADDLGLDDDIDFDFDLEPDDAKPLGAKPDGKAGNDDLDFDLEMESDEVSANEKAAKSAGKRPPAKSEDDFEFDFEDDGNLEKVESQEEFDLSDLDNMVDLKEQDRTKSAGDGDDLELDFDLQLEADDGTGEPPKVNLEGEEFEFEEFGDSKEVSVERADGNDDFQVNLAMGETSDNISTREQDDYHLEEDEEKLQKIFDTITLTGKPEIDDMEVEPEKSAPSKSKKKLGKPIILVLVLALIGAGGYFGFGFVKDMGIGIPFIGSEPPPPPDPGNLNIIAFDLDSKFVENQTAGKLFAITGKVKNEYPEPRSFIKISGKLYQPGKKMIQTQTVSAGNVISEMELGALDAESIKKRLTNRFGQNNMNTDIKTGQAVPFMIVFSNLPDQLEEYTVSVESSTAGKNN